MFLSENGDKLKSKRIIDFFWLNNDEDLAINLDFGEISSNARLFVIPSYQRKYKWDKTNILELLSDLKSDNKKYLGQILIKAFPNQERAFTILDGQQRITTLLLLIHNLFKNNESLLGEYKDVFNYLITETSPSENSNKLLSVIKYGNNKVIDYDDNKFEEQNNIINSVVKKFDKEQCKELLSKIRNIWFTIVKFSNSQSEYRIFEKINSTGLSLSTGDLLRNYLLMKAWELKAGNQIDENEFESFEKKVDVFFSFKLETFINEKTVFDKKEGRFFKSFVHFYVNAKVDEQNSKRLYNEIKREFERSNSNVTMDALIELFNDIANFAKYSKEIYDLIDKYNLNERNKSESNVLYPISKIYELSGRISFVVIMYCIRRKIEDFDLASELNREFISMLEYWTKISTLNFVLNKSLDMSYKIDAAIQMVPKHISKENIFIEIKNHLLSELKKGYWEKLTHLKEVISSIENPIYNMNKLKSPFRILMLLLGNEYDKIDGKSVKMSLSDLKNSSIEHIIPRNHIENIFWSKHLLNEQKESDYINSGNNLIVIQHDESDLNFDWEQKMEIYKRDKTPYAKSALKVIEKHYKKEQKMTTEFKEELELINQEIIDKIRSENG